MNNIIQNELAIIIPFYKIVFLRDALQSLADQTDKRFTVYIGDDNSPDCPLKLIKEYSETLTLVYKRFHHNVGKSELTRQWDRCLKMINNEPWFMILGDDDYLSNDAVSGFYATIKSSTYHLSVLRFNFRIHNCKTNTVTEEITFCENEKPQDFISKLQRKEARASLSEYVFRVASYKKFGIRTYPCAFYSDNMMVFEFAESSPIVNVHFGHVFIRLSDYNISGNAMFNKCLEDASHFFYTDLLKNYSYTFSKSQKQPFLNYLFDGLILKTTQIRTLLAFGIIYRNSNLKTTIRFFILWVKNKMSTALIRLFQK